MAYIQIGRWSSVLALPANTCTSYMVCKVVWHHKWQNRWSTNDTFV